MKYKILTRSILIILCCAILIASCARPTCPKHQKQRLTYLIQNRR